MKILATQDLAAKAVHAQFSEFTKNSEIKNGSHTLPRGFDTTQWTFSNTFRSLATNFREDANYLL